MKIEKIIFKVMLIIFIGNFFSLKVYSQDSIVPCFNPDGGLGTMGLASFNCPLAKTVANEPKIKDAHENKILEKLADKLALKATQRLEEIALLDQYFSQNNKDLMMNSIEVEKKCKLETISTPRCGPKTNQDNYKKKLEMLLGRFPESKDRKNTLYSRMRTKFSEMRGAQVNDNKCPISGTSGFFFISSQLTESDAVNFIDSLKGSRQTEVGNLYESFPQLKMLKNSIKNGPNGEKILAEFEHHLKTYDDKGPAKDYINSFLFTNANQEEMAKGLAFQCSAITDNINEFLCDDLDSFGMPDKFASKYFTGPGSEIDIAISNGLSCDTKKSNNGQLIEDDDKLTKGKSIFSLQKKFLDDSRPVKDDLIAKRNAGQFCDIYLCKSEASKNLKSCTSGGPVSSTDLLNSYCLDPKGASCNNKYLSYISYLASLEKDKKEIYEPNQSIASGSKDTIAKAKSYSSFYQNFLGVEGTLLAEGKAITPITMAEKKAEFVEKKLDPTVQTASLTQQPKEFAKIDRDDSFSRVEKPDFVSSPAPERDNDQFRRSFN
ncbi:MAG: hypothetical protein H7336_06815, partial [Bacteriovorax sp.]|nr:hypothetical protein [Bacteriovorax sp.]